MSTGAVPGLALTPEILHATLGALAIGFGVSSALFGVLTTQVYLYFRKFANDSIFIVCLVAIIWVLDFANQVFIAHCSYHYTVELWANPIALLTERPAWSLILQQTFGTLVGTFVKFVFTLRVWRFSKKNWVVTGFIALVITFQLGCGMVYTYQAFQQETIITGISNLQFIATMALVSGTVADFLVAAALAWYLKQLRTGYSSSDSIINGLMKYGLSTGFLSGALGLATLLLYHFRTMTFEFIATFFILSKVLNISLMTSLITRKSANGSTYAHQRSHSQTAANRSFGAVGLNSTTVKLSEFHAETWATSHGGAQFSPVHPSTAHVVAPFNSPSAQPYSVHHAYGTVNAV